MRFLLAISLFCTLSVGTIEAQQTDSLYLLSIEELLEINVGIGSRTEARPQFAKLVSVDVISEDELINSGYTDLGMAINSILPYVQYYRPTLMDGADHVFPLSFRGFAADQLLVLINGKRLNQSAMLYENSRINKGASAIDFRSIPINAVQRIEVLKEGASAQYGSDAIAGIINIVLKEKAFSEATLRNSITYVGDGFNKEVLTGFGKSFAKGEIMIYANFHERDFIDRAGLDERQQYFNDSPLNTGSPLKNHRYGIAASNDINIASHGYLIIDNTTKIYSAFLMNHRIGEAPGYFRRPLDNRNIREIYPNGFLPIIAPSIMSVFTYGGMETQINDWLIDLSIQYGSNSIDFFVKNSLNTSMGLRSPLSFYCGHIGLEEIINNTNINRTFNVGTYGPLSFSIGSEVKNEKYVVVKGDESSYKHGGELVLDGPNVGASTSPGAQVLPGFSPSNEINRSRQSGSLYIDLENQTLSQLSLGLAARLEQYSDFGSNINGKASLRFEPYKWVAIRGSISTGFRAPSLGQSFYSSTVTNFIGGVPYENGTFNIEHPISRALGANELKPERSKHYSAGISLKPVSNWVITTDWYLVYVDNRILFTGNFTANNAPSFASLFSSYGIGGARFFTNAVSTVTQGIDISVKHTIRINSKYTISSSLGLNYNNVSLNGKPVIPNQISNYTDIFFDRSEEARIISSQPETRLIGRMKISNNQLALNISGLYYGPITVVHSINDPNTDQVIYHGTVFDANCSYNFTNGITINIGGNNIFNKYPKQSNRIDGDSFTGIIFPYHPFSAYGFIGGNVYASIRYNFSK